MPNSRCSSCSSPARPAPGAGSVRAGGVGAACESEGRGLKRGAWPAAGPRLPASFLLRMRRRPEVGWGKAAVMAMAEKFDSLEEHLEKFVENIRQLGIIVSDFQPSSQAGLNQKL